MTDPGVKPDPGIVRQLAAIDPDLSVSWVELPDGTGRWGIFHSLQVEGRFEESVDRLARALQRDMALKGETVDYHECAMMARDAVRDQQLVCYVAEDDGGFRPLDGRIIEKLQRMDHYRRNLGLVGWKAMMRAKADVLESIRAREAEDRWQLIKRDKVMARMVSDILWGLKPSRSVEKRSREQDHGDDGDQRDRGAGVGAGAGQEPSDSGADGDAVSPAGAGVAAGSAASGEGH